MAGVAVGCVWLGWQLSVCGWGGSSTSVAGVSVRRVWLGWQWACVAGVAVARVWLGWQ